MPQPIILWNTKRHATHVYDDAGISITKTILAPLGPPAPYNTQPPNNLRTVPPLAYFCIRALTPYADQLHNLQNPVPYNKDVARALVPTKAVPRHVIAARKQDSQSTMDSGGQFDVQSVDPRLLATLAQVMHPIPAEFRHYDIPLSDVHLPLLQQVPSRDNFCFITLLSLPGCQEVSDNTIFVIRRLKTLAALDLRGTTVGSYGLTVLSRDLSWSDDELQSRTGCWGLRILCLHSCTNIGNEALPILSNFPLLSSIDLRFTGCTRHAVSKHLAPAGFRPSSKRILFYPAPLDVSLSALEHLPQSSIYSCPITSVFKLHVSELNHRTSFSEHEAKPFILRNMMEGPISLIDSDSDEECSWPAPEPVSRNVQARTTSTFYTSRLPRLETQIRAASDKEQLDPLALTRPPPPWSVLEALRPPVRQLDGPREQQPPKLASVDRARLIKRNLSGVEDMLTTIFNNNKKRKTESEFASASAPLVPVSKKRNPFLKSSGSTSKSNGSGGMVRSVFAEQRDAAISSAHVKRGMTIAKPWPKFCDSGPLKPSKTSTASSSSAVQNSPKAPAKIFRPITSYPVPPCPPEHLLLVPQIYPKKRTQAVVQQFPPSTAPVDGSDDIVEVEGIGPIRDDDSKRDERPPKKAGRDRGGTKNTTKKGKQKATGFDWDKWRRTTM
ncbi:hypothetical protein DEU56DRAFT_763017 [Suillus clintonianus]|uniref:uncharacterized protein n=1 Tax=Suillus clintonianus TaxID=1904413 RepID=UPI001B87395B|nr:uncharacterized protein DEU56DRAFT_763017 [Suillus clintonianus]KAG2157089.1 hypothetical protein DEU56DRAFT_763017 [Suillus clintonianus]